MRKLLSILAIGLALGLGACAGPQKSVLQGGSSLYVQVPNPVGKKELAVLEASYVTASRAFVACRRLRCTSVSNLRAYQAADRNAYAALVAARRAVRENPTVSGLSAVVIARRAIADYQSVLGRS